jgi:hypothetical protein
MDRALFILVFCALAALVVIGVIYGHLGEKKRREALAALASNLGWSFDPSKDPTHDERYSQFEVFRRGHSRAAYNTLGGSLTIDGRTFGATAGDFTYKVTSSNGKTTTTTTYNFSYLIVRPPFPRTPDLLLRREGFLDKLKGVLGFDDIDFESAEFSRRFYVKSTDKRFAYDVIHPRMMEFLLESEPPVVDLERGACCVTDGSRRWEAEHFRQRIAWAERFFDLWPDHLTRKLDTPAS